MISDNYNDQEIEKTLASLDGIEQAAPKPFLYTRLSGRLKNNINTLTSVQWRWVLAGVSLLIIMNALVLSYSSPAGQFETYEESLKLMAEEYGMSEIDIYDNTEIINPDEDQ